MGVAFDHIHNNRAPRDDITMLRIFIKADKAADDIGAESNAVSNAYRAFTRTYGMSAASVSVRLFLLSSLSS